MQLLVPQVSSACVAWSRRPMHKVSAIRHANTLEKNEIADD
jgi:hypothetical protein